MPDTKPRATRSRHKVVSAPAPSAAPPGVTVTKVEGEKPGETKERIKTIAPRAKKLIQVKNAQGHMVMVDPALAKRKGWA